MKKKLGAILLAVVLVLTLGIGSSVVLADKPQDNGVYNGNGAPSGPHYNLNIIGMENPKNADFDGGNGHRIFVDLGSKNVAKTTRIYLFEGDDFAVLDANGTDGRAEFQLPNPDPTNSGTTEYTVFIRVLGKPGGNIKMTTCATDPYTGEEVCSDLQVIEVRTEGKKKFNNVSAELLYIYAWVWNPVTEQWEYMRLPLFSAPLEGYLWKYDNSGVRIAQLRFYPGVQTTVPEPWEVAQLSSIVPNSGYQGQTITDVVITGANIDFTAVGVSSVDFGNKITVGSFTIDTATQLTVSITIAGDAKTGWRYVEVELDDGRTLSIPFEVTVP